MASGRLAVDRDARATRTTVPTTARARTRDRDGSVHELKELSPILGPLGRALATTTASASRPDGALSTAGSPAARRWSQRPGQVAHRSALSHHAEPPRNSSFLEEGN